MGRKRRDMSCLRPFCFYCQKSFKNQVILHHHQKAKHFGCSRCSKKFSSIDSLISHAKTSHNDNIEKVPNANYGRDNVALKIFGMQGVPRYEIQAWISKSVSRYWGKKMDRKIQKQKKKMKQLMQQKKQQQRMKNQQDNQMKGEQQDQENIQIPLQFTMQQG